MAHSNAIPIWSENLPGFDSTFGQAIPTLTPYLVTDCQSSGCVIVLPGGGYEGKADYEGGPIAAWLNQGGVSAAVLDYRVAPYRHPYPLMDVRRAIQFARCHSADWNIDPDHIGILGFSAGGHLAATVGTHFSPISQMPVDEVGRFNFKPDALILCYPVISFGKYGHIGSMNNLLGQNPSDSLRQDLSNELQVTNQTPPTFLWHTVKDQIVPVENALLFAQALRDHQVPFELHLFPDGPHGLALALTDPVVGQWRSLCMTWLTQQGFLGK